MQDLSVGNKAFESVAKWKYLATTPANAKCKHGAIKNLLKSQNTCCRSLQNILSSPITFVAARFGV
jgi:hypothetical protein